MHRPWTEDQPSPTDRHGSGAENDFSRFPRERLAAKRLGQGLPWSTHDPSSRSRVLWVFVVLGLLLRLIRYALNSPLWWNEAFVAVNLLKRGYADLLLPLDYGQVCPFAFLWVEKAITDALGFNEATLRLFPLLCSIAGLVLFVRIAGRFASGNGRWLAVAILAVAYHPIRLGSEVKPYAGDLLASVALTGLALDWLANRSRTGRLWRLSVVGPIAVTFSHPAAFVVGGVVIGLAPAVWRSNRWSARLALGTIALGSFATFATLYVLSTGAQSAAVLPAMREYWSEAFPPIDQPLTFLVWLMTTHAGRFLAYPCGGDSGASLLPMLFLIVGIIVTWRSGQRSRLAVLLAPFALTLLAAALRRHPYGGHPRITQHLAPAICLLIGVGLADALGKVRNPRRQARCHRLVILALLAIGLVPLGFDIAHPYRSPIERDARDFARWFWPEQGRDADLVCLRWDLGLAAWESPDLDTALYLVNQRIYSPTRTNPPPDHPPGSRPVRHVLYHSPRDEGPDLSSWLASMRGRYRSVRRSEYSVLGSRGPRSVVTVFEFRAPETDGIRTDRP